MTTTTPKATTATSVDPYEVKHYKALADHWWDENGPFWPLHRLNRLRVDWIMNQLAALGMTQAEKLTGLRVLDIGCGGGILSESLARHGAEVHGIDVVEKNLAIARLHAAETGLPIRYTLTTVEDLAQHPPQYDVVFNMEVVEHVAHLGTFMRAANRLVRPGGIVFVATINRTPLAGLVAIFGAEYVLRWLPRGTHRYHMLRKPQEIEALLAADAFSVRARSGVGVNPFTKSMYLRDSLSINYMLCAQKATKGEKNRERR